MCLMFESWWIKFTFLCVLRLFFFSDLVLIVVWLGILLVSWLIFSLLFCSFESHGRDRKVSTLIWYSILQSIWDINSENIFCELWIPNVYLENSWDVFLDWFAVVTCLFLCPWTAHISPYISFFQEIFVV